MTKAELLRLLDPYMDEIEIKIDYKEFSVLYICNHNTGNGELKLVIK